MYKVKKKINEFREVDGILQNLTGTSEVGV